jgi:hypothetical protein
MSDVILEIESGKSKRILTSGKRLDDNIVVTATGGSGGKRLVGDNADYFFYMGTRIEDINEWDFSQTKSFRYVFQGLKQTEPPLIDTSSGVDFTAFLYNAGMEVCPLYDTRNAKVLRSFFSTNHALTVLPLINTSNCTDFQWFLNDCKGVIEVPLFDFSKATTLNSTFTNCTALTTIKARLDLRNVTNVVSTFKGCASLEEVWIDNIPLSLTIGSGTTYGHLLKVECIIHAIKELLPSTTLQTLTMGSANLEKIAGLYCRITDDTSEKMTMELCESTDEGAMTLEQYALLKNWQFR